MKKSELISSLSSKHPNLKQMDAEKVVDIVLGSIATTLSHKNRVELRGFGVLSPRMRTSRQARNPKTGEVITVNDRYTIHFKTAKYLADRLNSKS